MLNEIDARMQKAPVEDENTNTGRAIPSDQSEWIRQEHKRQQKIFEDSLEDS